MEFPKTFLLVIFCSFALVTANVNEVKNKMITEHMKEFGNGIAKNVNYEISRTAKAAFRKADIKKSSKEVINCIQNQEKEGLETVNNYSKKFLDEVRKYETKADEQSVLNNGIFSETADSDLQIMKTLNQLSIQYIKNSKKAEHRIEVAIFKCFPEDYP